MGSRIAELLLLVCLVLAFSSWPSMGMRNREYHDEEGVEEKEVPFEKKFLLQMKEEVVRTDAGDVRVVRGFAYHVGVESPMHIGFINMEPSSLFLPQYMDSTLTIFVRRGEARIGWIHKAKMEEKEMKTGDLYVIPAGSTFYIANIGEGERLRLICSIDNRENFGRRPFQSFFIGGGLNPTSIFAGFGPKTMATALNISIPELGEFMRQVRGPIVYANVTQTRSLFNQNHGDQRQEDGEDESAAAAATSTWTWAWRKVLRRVSLYPTTTTTSTNKSGKTVHFPDVYNLYKRKPDFENKYGSTMSLYDNEYTPLGIPNISVYLANLAAGAMLGPHLNPTAIEFGVVLLGSGSIEIVYPNGTTAMVATVGEDDVFWVPQYFPFCQIASRNGPFVFFGFTTASRDNKPQILVGEGSVLRTMNRDVMAMAFGVPIEEFDRVVKAQNGSVIFPSPGAAPADKDEGEGVGIRRFGDI
ncbi:hypothetical protein Scep_004819 [Stephania cephalantha]|uniref:Cupin type-1 domain-containing protein n=1 Tax=Stephania cephalantha TaxID=152367 RepID=A0AAP0PWZ0_9MAGN